MYEYECIHEEYKISHDPYDPSCGLKWCQKCGKCETKDKPENWPLPENAPYRAEATIAQHFAMLTDNPPTENPTRSASK